MNSRKFSLSLRDLSLKMNPKPTQSIGNTFFKLAISKYTIEIFRHNMIKTTE